VPTRCGRSWQDGCTSGVSHYRGRLRHCVASGVSCNVEAVRDWSVKPVEAETVGELVIQVNDGSQESERFQRLDEEAEQRLKTSQRK